MLSKTGGCLFSRIEVIMALSLANIRWSVFLFDIGFMWMFSCCRVQPAAFWFGYFSPFSNQMIIEWSRKTGCDCEQNKRKPLDYFNVDIYRMFSGLKGINQSEKDQNGPVSPAISTNRWSISQIKCSFSINQQHALLCTLLNLITKNVLKVINTFCDAWKWAVLDYTRIKKISKSANQILRKAGTGLIDAFLETLSITRTFN